MRRVKKENLVNNEIYLVFVDYEWSPSGFDIAEYTKYNHYLASQNGDNLINTATIIFELPITD